MCGIFGIISYGTNTYHKAQIYRDLVRALLEASESRGGDASGLCLNMGNSLKVFKDKLTASEFIKSRGYSDLIRLISYDSNFKSLIGHTRSETRGSHLFNVNNHPIVANSVIGIHNGTLWGEDDVFRKYKGRVTRAGEVDSEIIFRLIDMYLAVGDDIVSAVKKTLSEVKGSMACAFVTSKNTRYVTLFRNDSAYASISVYHLVIYQTILFASTDYILEKALGSQKKNTDKANLYVEKKITVPPNTGIRIDTLSGGMFTFKTDTPKPADKGQTQCPYHINDSYCGATDCSQCKFADDIGFGG